MSLAAPLNLLWSIPVLGAVTLLYMLRRPRRDLYVPSTLLWRNMPQESVQVRRLQKLTPQLLYFLQMIAATLLVLASAQPQITRAAGQRQFLAIILDNGVTMQCRDTPNGDTRFSQARQKAEQIVRDMPDANTEFSIVTTAPPRLVTTSPSDAGQAVQAISTIMPSDAAADLPGASLIAAGALRESSRAVRSGVRAVVISDGAWDRSEDAAGIIKPLAFAQPAFAAVASQNSPISDIALDRLAVQRDPIKPDTQLQVFVRISSIGSADALGRLVLSIDGRIIVERNIKTTQAAPTSLTFDLPARKHATSLTATLQPETPDDLAADNIAYAVLPAAGAARVLLIGGPLGVDPGLERLLGLLPGVVVDETRLSALPSAGAPAGYSLYILDPEGEVSGANDVATPNLPGNSLIFSPDNGDFSQVDGGDQSTQIVDWNRTHPALRFADLTGAGLRSAGAWRTVGTWQPLIESRQGIVAAARDIGGSGARAIQFSFSPRASGFDTLPVFPVLISNAVDWLDQTSVADSSPAGNPITLAPTPGGWTITRESSQSKSQQIGENLCDERSSPCSESRTDQSGIYVARSKDATELFARSADIPAHLASQEHPLLENYKADPSVHDRSQSGRVAVSLLRWAALICLFALLLEWSVAYAPRPIRRGLV